MCRRDCSSCCSDHGCFGCSRTKLPLSFTTGLTRGGVSRRAVCRGDGVLRKERHQLAVDTTVTDGTIVLSGRYHFGSQGLLKYRYGKDDHPQGMHSAGGNSSTKRWENDAVIILEEHFCREVSTLISLRPKSQSLSEIMMAG